MRGAFSFPDHKMLQGGVGVTFFFLGRKMLQGGVLFYNFWCGFDWRKGWG